KDAPARVAAGSTPGSADGDRERTALLQGPLVGRTRVDAFEEAAQVRVVAQVGAHRGRLDRETHLDVGRGEALAREPAAAVQRLLHPVQVQLHLRGDEAGQGAVDDGAGY